MIIRFVDIGRIVNHHYLIFLFTIFTLPYGLLVKY